tara:strand:+ start:590 stop:1087 length:498 start_codon:yes stop_codon:yes gene_type:complete
MTKSFFTPTHDKNGRKLSKAERRAANKAKHAASKKSSKKAAPKAELNPRKVQAVAEAFDFSYIDACARTYTPLPEEKSKPKRKSKKRKSKRLSHNDKLEAQAQRLSRGTAGNEPALAKEPKAMATSKPSAQMEIFDLAGGDPVAAARHAAFLGMGLDAVTLDDIL